MALICLHPPTLPLHQIDQIHIFDLDRTLSEANASLLLAHYLLDRKLISNRAWLRCWVGYWLNKCGLKTLESQIHALFDAFFKGLVREPIEGELLPFWHSQLKERLRPTLVRQMQEIRQKGQIIALFSASPDFLIRCIAEQLEINFYLATEFQSDASGQLFESLGRVAGGRVKAEGVSRLRSRYPGAKIHGYSDSREDIPFLASVDQAWLVSPDRALLRWSKHSQSAKIWPLDSL